MVNTSKNASFADCMGNLWARGGNPMVFHWIARTIPYVINNLGAYCRCNGLSHGATQSKTYVQGVQTQWFRNGMPIGAQRILAFGPT